MADRSHAELVQLPLGFTCTRVLYTDGDGFAKVVEVRRSSSSAVAEDHGWPSAPDDADEDPAPLAMKRTALYGLTNNTATEDTRADAARLIRELHVLRLFHLPSVVRSGADALFLSAHSLHYNEYPTSPRGDAIVSIVMPLVDGTLGSAWTANPAQFTPEHALVYGYQLCVQLAVLHALGIAHRDVKPDNVFISVSTDDGPWLGDFGLARCLSGVVGRSPTGSSATDVACSSYVFTRGYRALELLMAAQRPSESADTWAAGVVIAELCLRKRLFSPDARRASGPVPAVVEMLRQLATTAELKSIGVAPEWLEMGVEPASIAVLSSLAADQAGARGKAGPQTTDIQPPLFASLMAAGAPSPLAELLVQMLALRPSQRISARAAVLHPAFDPVRDESDIAMIDACRENSEAREYAARHCSQPSVAPEDLRELRRLLVAAVEPPDAESDG